MFTPRLIVNRQDRWRLLQRLQAARSSWRTYAPSLDWLRSQLEQAHACEPAEVPQDVVTMNSRVELEDLRTGATRAVTLVYPDAGDSPGRVSVLEPTGLALLGSRVGDVVGWSEADGSRTARLRRLCYQPEAAGDYTL